MSQSLTTKWIIGGEFNLMEWVLITSMGMLVISGLVKVRPHSKFVVWISDKTMRDINLRYKYFEVGGW